MPKQCHINLNANDKIRNSIDCGNCLRTENTVISLFQRCANCVTVWNRLHHKYEDTRIELKPNLNGSNSKKHCLITTLTPSSQLLIPGKQNCKLFSAACYCDGCCRRLPNLSHSRKQCDNEFTNISILRAQTFIHSKIIHCWFNFICLNGISFGCMHFILSHLYYFHVDVKSLHDGGQHLNVQNI